MTKERIVLIIQQMLQINLLHYDSLEFILKWNILELCPHPDQEHPTIPLKSKKAINKHKPIQVAPKLLYCLHFRDFSILTIPSHNTDILPSLKQGNLNECGSLVHLYPGYKQRKMKICNMCSCNREIN